MIFHRLVFAIALVSTVAVCPAAQPTASITADGMTPLHQATLANEPTRVAALLKAGANPDAANRYGITPLWLAATNGSATVTRLLLKAGAAAKTTLPHGETAVMAAARTGDPDTVKLLLQAGADPNASESTEHETALMWAAAENNAEAIQALIAGGANPNLHSQTLNLAPMDWMQVGMVSTVLPHGGFTALMYAARQDSKDAVRALADGHTNLDEQDPEGATALHLAIINQHYDLAALLLEKGANPNVADSTGMTAIYAAVDMNLFRSEIGRPAHPLMDKLTALDIVRMAVAHGGNPNAQQRKPALARHHGFPDGSLGEGATALMRAAKALDIDAMKVLLEAGAKPSLGTPTSSAVLALANTRPGPGPAAANITAAFKLLAQHGADLKATNAQGQTPLHIAARLGANATVRALAELGADLNVKDSAGKTALDLVSEPGRNRHDDTAALLKELSAQRTK